MQEKSVVNRFNKVINKTFKDLKFKLSNISNLNSKVSNTDFLNMEAEQYNHLKLNLEVGEINPEERPNPVIQNGVLKNLVIKRKNKRSNTCKNCIW
ncbi:hypothetical protein NX779_03485 [Mycoplasma cottewii]|uniref:Uncharacterized protein n=1 Tax=Mycoplasma cottewii TaxID=51364 RepID=A0ABY5TW20_9MOLU|nr:hypothetical protein [Mycoplasma cottewii]UWD34847.1 hypothetical protein NX779_03485 [Mycoplasma cottewii]